MDAAASLAMLHLGATFYMVGVIWFVQSVHYPLFASVGASGFRAYHEGHMARTGRVVGAPMLVEAATALALVLVPSAPAVRASSAAGLALLAVVWLSTVLGQVPEHRRLSRGRSESAIRRLVRGNAIRTAAWTLRAPIAVHIALAHAA